MGGPIQPKGAPNPPATLGGTHSQQGRAQQGLLGTESGTQQPEPGPSSSDHWQAGGKLNLQVGSATAPSRQALAKIQQDLADKPKSRAGASFGVPDSATGLSRRVDSGSTPTLKISSSASRPTHVIGGQPPAPAPPPVPSSNTPRFSSKDRQRQLQQLSTGIGHNNSNSISPISPAVSGSQSTAPPLAPTRTASAMPKTTRTAASSVGM